jgi:hypothetical protein
MVRTDLSALSFKIDGVLPASTPDLASARVTCRVVSAPYLSRAFHQEKPHAKKLTILRSRRTVDRLAPIV